MHVLKDRLIAVRLLGATAPRTHTLPEVLALLWADDPVVEDFPGLGAEQYASWWRFLVRAAAQAIRESGASAGDPVLSAGRLEQALAGCEPSSAWELHVEDPTVPAFLQCAWPAGAKGKGTRKGIGELTQVVGQKNHERKLDQMRALDAEGLLFALVEHQLGTIWGGPGLFCSQLTGSNNGQGSGAAFMGVRIGIGLNETFRHDVRVLLDRWETVVRDHGLAGEIWALWAEPWDGATPLPARELSPAFIPFARRVRVVRDEDGLFRAFVSRTSEKARVLDHTGGGNLGDPFSPLIVASSKKDEFVAMKVRGTMERGYTYDEVGNLLTGTGPRGGAPSPSVTALSRDPKLQGRRDVRVLFTGIAYDQGKVLGFHWREIPVPAGGAMLLDPAQTDALGKIHVLMLADVQCAGDILAEALVQLLGESASRQGTGQYKALRAWRGRLHDEVDRFYIETLLDRASQSTGGKKGAWHKRLKELTLELVDKAGRSLAVRATERLRRVALAEARAIGLLRKEGW